MRLSDSATTNQPCPIGVIRFTGHSDAKFSVRLSLPEDGVFYANWPLGHTRFRITEWPDLTLSSTPQRLLPEESLKWLAPLRNTDAPYLTTAGRSEKFLLYDAEFPFPLPIALAPVNDDFEQLQVVNKSDKPLHDLVLYRPATGGQWSTAHADAIAPAPRSDVPATSPAEPWPMKFTPAGEDPSRFLADDWTSRLKSFQLQSADIDLILATLKTYALDESQTTAVYRLDEAVLDNLLPLKITPPPARVRRLALVIAHNIDPNVPRILDRLIAQLGDPNWHNRDSATTTLARFGPVAAPRLRQALSSNDPEIVLRAERLLARLTAR